MSKIGKNTAPKFYWSIMFTQDCVVFYREISIAKSINVDRLTCEKMSGAVNKFATRKAAETARDNIWSAINGRSDLNMIPHLNGEEE